MSRTEGSGKIEVCERCGEDCFSTIMSMFNTQTICIVCKCAEVEHPKYEEARQAESEAVKRGDRNFPGIGLPEDLLIQ